MIEIYSRIRLKRAKPLYGHLIPAGTLGTIVHIYTGGSFEVEFSEPRPCVMTLESNEVEQQEFEE